MPDLLVPTDIAHVIQIAIAPVFMLAGIGALLNVMTNRLGRVVDRWRKMEKELEAQEGAPSKDRIAHLAVLDRRMAHINRAIALSTLSALLICIVIILLFTGQLLRFPVASMVSILFIASMSVLVGSLLSFLLEIRIASRMLRVARTVLRPGAPPRHGNRKS
ncbi:MAG: DUF2721 domain-containing protein [Alphaproteobacteria bacterium]|nr:hypothetical protein [Hyphomonas sp.]MBR9809031.1 DUF2721 domain-containing protein [Alphaproteobacteria bacterium]|tara:strand:+ start:9174 stop:9659 length:486 start_codon:yes stop_codon:yes gene_type:complete